MVINRDFLKLLVIGRNIVVRNILIKVKLYFVREEKCGYLYKVCVKFGIMLFVFNN